MIIHHRERLSLRPSLIKFNGGGLSWTLAVFYVTLFAMGYGQMVLNI